MRKVKFFIVLAVIGMIFTVTSCSLLKKKINGEGEIVTKEYLTTDASKIDVYNIGMKDSKLCEVNIHVGLQKKVVISSQENIIDKLSCDVKDDKLKINGSRFEKYITDSIVIDVYGYSFDKLEFSRVIGNIELGCISSSTVKLEASGASLITAASIICSNLDVELSGASKLDASVITCSDLDLEMSGASKLNCPVFTATNSEIDLSGASKFESALFTTSVCDIDLSGASNANVSGTCDNLKLEASGASDFSGSLFSCQKIKASISGASTAKVKFSETLNGSASGASSIKYYGNSDNVSVSTSGSSTVTKA